MITHVYTESFCEGVSTGIQSEGSLYHTKHADGELTPIHQYFRRAIARDGTKPGLWTLDWTMDWTMDWIMDSILDSIGQ